MTIVVDWDHKTTNQPTNQIQTGIDIFRDKKCQVGFEYNIQLKCEPCCKVARVWVRRVAQYVLENRWVGRQTQCWPRHKAVYFSWFGPELFCLLLGPPGFNCWFSFAPVFQWCCSTPQGSPGVGRNTLFLSSPHLCFIIVFIRDLIVSRDDPLKS